MDTQKLLNILTELHIRMKAHKKLENGRFTGKLEALERTYRSLDISERHKEQYECLIKRGAELSDRLKKDVVSKETVQKAAVYLRFLQASVYDFKEDLRGINLYTRFFILTAALFMALTPQFYGFMLPVLFVLPVFAGLKGIRRRSSTGFLMTLAVLPMSLMSGITWIRYIFQVALPDFDRAVISSASAWNVPSPAAQLLIILPGLLSAVMLAACVTTAYLGYKYRNMFV